MEYQIVSARTIKVLAEQVKEEIADGWRPLGGVGWGDESFGIVMQAMVRDEGAADNPAEDLIDYAAF